MTNTGYKLSLLFSIVIKKPLISSGLFELRVVPVKGKKKNYLPNNKTLDQSNMKAFEDIKIDMIQ